MSALAFLRTQESQDLLERAARAAGTPLSLHYIDRNQEGPRILGWGQAAACAHVTALEQGAQTCRQSRQTVSAMAVRQRRGMAFVCHMGLACYSLPALADEGFVLTFGPYCPSEEARALPFDVKIGLEALIGESAEELPFTLDDVHVTPLDAIPEIADWTVERLTAQWEAYQAADAEEDVQLDFEEAEQRPTPRNARSGNAVVDELPAREIALALASGDQPAARRLLRGVLDEIEARPSVRMAVARARMVAAVGAVLEAAEHAAMPTSKAWEAWPGLTAHLESASDPRGLIDAAMTCLGPLRREASPRSARRTTYAQLNEIIGKRLAERVTLSEAAKQLGETPSAISKRLERKFGMSYSEYLARLRIEKAKELLRRTRFTASEVGRRVGIRDQSNFSKTFKKIEGVSPGDYRKRYGR